MIEFTKQNSDMVLTVDSGGKRCELGKIAENEINNFQIAMEFRGQILKTMKARSFSASLRDEVLDTVISSIPALKEVQERKCVVFCHKGKYVPGIGTGKPDEE